VTGTLRETARTVRERVRTFFEAPPASDAGPLELLHAALDDLERRAQASGRGSRVFPYTRVVVHVAQRGADRAAIEAVFGRLGERLRERLAEIRCAPPASLAVSVSVTDDADAGAPLLRVECGSDTDAAPPPAAAPAVPELHVTIVRGRCDRADYAFAGGAVSIGRGAEPADALGRVRRNDIAFLDERDGVTETVARAHARIAFDTALGAYVLFNESSSNPTYLVRAGRSLRVSPRDPRGVRVQSGDEIQIGRAVLRIAVGDDRGPLHSPGGHGGQA